MTRHAPAPARSRLPLSARWVLITLGTDVAASVAAGSSLNRPWRLGPFSTTLVYHATSSITVVPFHTWWLAPLLCLFAAAALLAGWVSRQGIGCVGAGLAAGGILGNTLIGVLHPTRGVADYLTVNHGPWFTSFNFADVGVVVGSLLLVLGVLLAARRGELRLRA